MTELDPSDDEIDGRIARRQRNVNAVLDVVHEILAEDLMIPTIEQVSKRSGRSLRSMYRYFADPGEMIDATIRRIRELNADLAHVPHLGRGPFDERVADLVSARMRVYEKMGPTWRASVVNAPTVPGVALSLSDARAEFRAQFNRQFATELDRLDESQRMGIEASGDALTQLDTIDYITRYRGLEPIEVERALRSGLRALFAGETPKQAGPERGAGVRGSDNLRNLP